MVPSGKLRVDLRDIWHVGHSKECFLGFTYNLSTELKKKKKNQMYAFWRKINL